eukprot:10111243-Alexandrium_andersonii.AAC.1
MSTLCSSSCAHASRPREVGEYILYRCIKVASVNNQPIQQEARAVDAAQAGTVRPVPKQMLGAHEHARRSIRAQASSATEA